MNLTRQHKTGLLILVGGALLIFGINYLKGFGLWKSDNDYVAVYANVEGLSEASPLYLNGYKVGQVVGTEMIHDGSNRIAVTYQITEERLSIPADSRIQIYSADLFTKAAKLELGKTSVLANKGDTLGGATQRSMTEMFSEELDPIKKRAETLMASVDTVLASFQRIMDEGTQTDIAVSFSTIRQSLESFSRSAARMDKLIQRESPALEKGIDNFASLSDTLQVHSGNIGRVMSNLSLISDSLANGGIGNVMITLAETSTRLQSIMKKMDEGEGSLGLLANDDSLYVNMNNAAQELDLLLEDFRKNPNRYVQVSVFGKKEKKPALSDKDVLKLKERMNCCP